MVERTNNKEGLYSWVVGFVRLLQKVVPSYGATLWYKGLRRKNSKAKKRLLCSLKRFLSNPFGIQGKKH